MSLLSSATAPSGDLSEVRCDPCVMSHHCHGLTRWCDCACGAITGLRRSIAEAIAEIYVPLDEEGEEVTRSDEELALQAITEEDRSLERAWDERYGVDTGRRA